MSKLIPITIAISVCFFGIIPLSVMLGLPEWIILLIVTIAPFGFILYRLIRSGTEFHDTFRYSLPYQVLKLVQQAHANQEFNTDPNIRVCPEMRERLIYPLNPTLAAINGATEYPVTEHEFIYDIAES